MENTPVIEQQSNMSKGARAVTIISAVLCVIFGLIFIMNSILIVMGWFEPEKPPMIFGTCVAMVGSDAMEGENEDSVSADSLVFIKKADYEEIAVGDVVVYMINDSAIIGRVVSESSSGAFWVQGDNMENVYFAQLTEENLFGKVSASSDFIGNVMNFVLSPVGIILFIGLPAAVCFYIIILEIRDIKRSKKDNGSDDDPQDGAPKEETEKEEIGIA